MPFRLERTSQRCLLVSGELDLMTASQLHLALGDERIDVVDLSGVTFMDVAGLRPLLTARCVGGRPLLVRHPSPCVRRLLELWSAAGGHVPDGWLSTPPDRCTRAQRR